MKLKKKYQEVVLAEYEKAGQTPVYCSIGDKNKIPVPLAYGGDLDAFSDDLFQSEKTVKEYNRVGIESITGYEIGDLYAPRPLEHHLKNVSKEQSVEALKKQALRRYNAAVKTACRVGKEYPDNEFAVSLNAKALNHMNRAHKKYCFKKLAKGIGKTLQFTAEQSVQMVVGAAGALPMAAYYLMDKKVKPSHSKSKFKTFADEKLLPYVRKGALKALIPLSLVGGGRIMPHLAEDKQKEVVEIVQGAKTPSEQNLELAQQTQSEFLACVAFFEDFKSKPYLCPAKRWTIGYGTTTLPNGAKVNENTSPVTIEQGKGFVLSHANKYVYPTLEHINKPLTCGQILGTQMFNYNNDERKFKDSRLLKTINSGASDNEVCRSFSLYRNVSGDRSYGLINRRGFESYLWQCENIGDVFCLSRDFVGSPDVEFYHYGTDNKKDPIQNKDDTFNLLDFETIDKSLKRFTAKSIETSVLSMLPEEDKQHLIDKYDIRTGKDGRLHSFRPRGTDEMNTGGKTIALQQVMRQSKSR